MHNSGTGEFGYADLDAGRFVPVCFCPGYLRGLDFIGDFAIVGLSKPRRGGVFDGLKLQESLEEKKSAAFCGVFVIDLKTGDAVHRLIMDNPVEELYDVAVLRDCRRPIAVGFQSDEIHRVLTIDEWGEL